MTNYSSDNIRKVKLFTGNTETVEDEISDFVDEHKVRIQSANTVIIPDDSLRLNVITTVVYEQA